MKRIVLILSAALAVLGLAGCGIGLSVNDGPRYGSITVAANSSRAIDVSSITSAKVTVTGTGIDGELSGETAISNGKSSSALTIDNIPFGKNYIVTVYACNASGQLNENEYILRSVFDMDEAAKTIRVTRSSTALGNVFEYLRELGKDTSKYSKEDLASITAAIDSDLDFLEINSAAIASDIAASGVSGLKDKSVYVNGYSAGNEEDMSIVLHVKGYQYIWYWDDGAAGQGAEMESDSEKGDGWYTYTFENKAKINIIFRTSSSSWDVKTEDLSRTPGVWYYENGAWTGTDTSDSVKPTVTWLSPSAGSTVSDCVNFIVSASDDATGIASVEFFVDGVSAGSTNGAFAWTFDSSSVENGKHTVYAEVKDGAGNKAQTSEITITTDNAEKQPVAVVDSAKTCTATVSTTFDGSKSTGSIATYTWDFGDGSTENGATVTHKYAATGSYTATLTVKSEGGLTDSASISVTVKEKGSFLHRDFREETVYFMMTDRFCDGDKTNNNIWGDEYLPNGESDMYTFSSSKTGILSYYHGGDFKGIINNLDYIKDMGFTAIWITPAVKQAEGRYFNGLSGNDYYEASAFHGYWGYDFDQIDPHLHSSGINDDGWDDYKDLIEACHAKGIRVMQDIVINHGNHSAAGTSKWASNPVQTIMDGKKWAWKTLDPYYEEVPEGSTPSKNGFYSYYGFGQCSDLIDFGHLGEDGKDSRQHLINVYKKFIDAGVDAFRIDTMAYIPNEFAGEFADAMYNYAKEQGNDYFYMIGEAWCGRNDAVARHSYDTTKSLNMLDLQLSCMDYPGEMQSCFSNNGDGFETRWNNVESSSNYKINDVEVMDGDEWTKTAMFVDNHDVYRCEIKFSEAQFKNALNYVYLFRGVPIVYYGTEAYYSWDGTHPCDEKEDVVARWMLGDAGISYVKNNKPNMYKHLIMLNQLHASSDILKYGQQTNISLGSALVYTRTYNGKTGYFVNSISGDAASYSFDVAAGTYKLYTCSGDTLTSSTVSGGSSVTVTSPANGFAFLDPQ